MRIEHLNDLLSRQLITEKEYKNLEPVVTRKIVSVFYELRILLYLGVLLFSTGIGILIYKNIGDLGHLLSIIALFALTVVCFWYAFKNAPRYSDEKVKAPTPYHDYIVLLGCLLFISGLTYLQFQYNVFDDGLGMTTLVTALFFFFAAYRFDHLGVLSLGITAFASFWGISVSPQKWYSSDFLTESDLHNTALVFAAGLAAAAVLLDRRSIKKHFTFSYLNFAVVIFLTAALTGVFINYNSYGWYLLLLFVGCGLTVYAANWKKSFLFLLYAFVFGYIGLTYALADVIIDDPSVWFLYLMLSCGGFVFFIIRYRNYFKRAE